MRYNFYPLIVTFFFAVSTMLHPSFAAEIKMAGNAAYLKGEIVKGDAERFALLISKVDAISGLRIDSPGGDVSEALKIAQIIYNLKTVVAVEKTGYCVSACFFIYLAAQTRGASKANADGTLPSKNPHRHGFVGIHRPYLRTTDGGKQAIYAQQQIIKKIRSYLNSKDVPQYLIDEMMAHPSNDVYWLKERDLEAIGEYEVGYEEALIAKCGSKRYRTIFEEGWSQEKQQRLFDCSFDYWFQDFLPVHKNFIASLREGSRPWNSQ